MSNRITIPRGNTLYLTISILIDSEPYLLNEGDTVYFTVKTRAGGEIILQKKLTLENTDENGELLLTLEPADTKQLCDTYKYDAAIRFSDGEFYTFIQPSDFVVLGVITEAGELIE